MSKQRPPTQTSARRKRVFSALKRFKVMILVDPGILEPGGEQIRTKLSDHQVELCLRRLCKTVTLYEFVDAVSLVEELERVRPHVVFNLTQLAYDDRRKDGHICSLLELQGVAYTGAGPRGLMLGRDKAVSKMIAHAAGFRVPNFFVLSKTVRQPPKEVELPVIVKPRFEDASEAISQDSVVHSRTALLERIAHVRGRGFDDIICEEYIPGRELLIGMVGTEMVRPKQYVIGKPIPGDWIATETFKYDKAFRKRHQIGTAYAELTTPQMRKLRQLTHDTALALELGDYSRIDCRMTPAGEFVFLEGNPNPGLAPPNTTWAGTWDPVNYDAMIAEITYRARERRR